MSGMLWSRLDAHASLALESDLVRVQATGPPAGSRWELYAAQRLNPKDVPSPV
jgi:hypothetical protein